MCKRKDLQFFQKRSKLKNKYFVTKNKLLTHLAPFIETGYIVEHEELCPIDLTGGSSPREWTLGALHDGIESLPATTILNPLGHCLR
jgi:hypothetical protein